ncbi:ATP-binding protein [Winogradskyella sp. MH6]|uniref:ATP-binding protein n=1 Tax=Winogradskyella sp. MH6 TaxID=2929510 RepID=UPI001FB36F0C|nr:sensor histidine kinase [Winogradskyella sp. MH6]
MVILLQKRLKIILYCLLVFSLQHLLYSQNSAHIDSIFNRFDIKIKSNLIEAEKLAIKGVSVAEKGNDKNDLFKAYVNSIKINRVLINDDDTQLFIEKALKIEKFVTDETLKIDLYYEIAQKELRETNTVKAFASIEKSIQLALKLNDSLRLSEGLICKGGIFISDQNLDTAKTHFFKAINIAKHNHYYDALSYSYHALAEINYSKYKDSAIYYYDRALKFALKANNKYREASLYSDFAFLYIYHEEPDKVLPLINKAEKLSKEIGSKRLLHNIYYTLGYYYDLAQNYSLSIAYHRKAIDEYGDFVSPIQLRNTYIMLSGALWHNGNYKEAYDYQDKFIVLNDSIFNLQKAKEFDNIRTKYEVEKKDTAIALLEKENKIVETRQRWLSISIVFLCITLSSIYFFFKQKIRSKNTILSKEKELNNKERERLEKENELTEIKAYYNGQEKERSRLAKELHDGIGGQLASINLTLTHINAELKNDSLKKVSKDLVNTFKELRLISHNLNNKTLNKKSLKDSLQELKTLHEQRKDLKVEISIFPDNILENLEPKTSHNLYRILQEILTNIAMHSKATLVEISFNKHNDILVVIAEDNGCGFKVEDKNYGMGLKNIEERIISLKGQFNIDSQISKGTQVIIEIPLNNKYICIK